MVKVQRVTGMQDVKLSRCDRVTSIEVVTFGSIVPERIKPNTTAIIVLCCLDPRRKQY